MASAKDTFEANTFEANTFACGVWRGAATVVVVPTIPGIEIVVPDARLHIAVPRNERPHFAVPDARPHFVVEEENGGNGTLAMVRRGIQADAAVVLECSEFTIFPAVRGAVWFELKTYGQAGHSGSKATTISALKKAIQAMEILEGYHDRLLATSRGIRHFDIYEDPMPITFGQCESGSWPSMVPAEATVKGVFGFLTNKDRHQVQREMREAILNEGE